MNESKLKQRLKSASICRLFKSFTGFHFDDTLNLDLCVKQKT